MGRIHLRRVQREKTLNVIDKQNSQIKSLKRGKKNKRKLSDFFPKESSVTSSVNSGKAFARRSGPTRFLFGKLAGDTKNGTRREL